MEQPGGREQSRREIIVKREEKRRRSRGVCSCLCKKGREARARGAVALRTYAISVTAAGEQERTKELAWPHAA